MSPARDEIGEEIELAPVAGLRQFGRATMAVFLCY
jgi:hypothetical protein